MCRLDWGLLRVVIINARDFLELQLHCPVDEVCLSLLSPACLALLRTSLSLRENFIFSIRTLTSTNCPNVSKESDSKELKM